METVPGARGGSAGRFDFSRTLSGASEQSQIYEKVRY